MVPSLVQTEGWQESNDDLIFLAVRQREGMLPCNTAFMKDALPSAGEENMVVLTDHLLRGVNFPLFSIVHSLLSFCGIQLFHLAPNSVVFISIFVHLCEAFIRILLDLDLFWLFY